MKNSYVIDTHIFLWLIFNPQNINPKILAILEDTTNEVLICSTTLWEISIKFHLGKLDLYGLLPSNLPKVAENMSIKIVEIEHNIMATLFQLPSIEKHKDPFNRIMIWQCICGDYILLSQDSKFDDYQRFGLNLFKIRSS